MTWHKIGPSKNYHISLSYTPGHGVSNDTKFSVVYSLHLGRVGTRIWCVISERAIFVGITSGRPYSLLFTKCLKIQYGCQSWPLIPIINCLCHTINYCNLTSIVTNITKNQCQTVVGWVFMANDYVINRNLLTQSDTWILKGPSKNAVRRKRWKGNNRDF